MPKTCQKHIPINNKIKMSKEYAFIVAPMHVPNELLKPNRINCFGKKY